MKISLEWLNAYLDRPTDAGEAECVLTDIGFPLDGVEPSDGDTVLDVEVTSNRPDCLSHVGVARELAAATGRRLREPDLASPDASGSSDVHQLTRVDNEAPELCPLYTARVITGVTVGPSPPWLARRIEAIGLRPVNNVVDMTNFVLQELGQPLHAFDMDRLAGKRIVVRRAAEHEPFTAIDGSKHALRRDMLVIADAERAVGVAGIMGGLDSEVGQTTTDILLESARFDPLNIRSTSRALKLASDSSYRFERGVDPRGVDRASRRAARLIVELAGGSLAGGVIEAGEPLPPHRIVQMRPQRCNQVLGLDLPRELMGQLLAALGLEPDVEEDLITCTIPSHRLDLCREIDLIEEVARLHGYQHVPMRQEMRIVVRPPQERIEARKTVGRVLVAHGYHETVTFSFLSPEAARPFAGEWELVTMDEQKKRAEPALRPSLLPSLLACRKANQDAGNRHVRLFEAARVFGRRDGRYVERSRLALLADATAPAETLREVRGALEELLGAVGRADGCRIMEAAGQAPPWAVPAAHIVDADAPERVLGAYGPATDPILKLFDLQTPVILAELDYDALVAAYPPQPRVGPLPRFPAIERDLSIVVDEHVRWLQVASCIRAAGPALLERLDFVTVFRGGPIPKGRKSVTLRMTFRDPARTLEHDEVSSQVDAVVERLGAELGAELRA